MNNKRHVITLKGSFFSRKIEMAFRHIPAGRFLMGQRGRYSDETPVHEVVIIRDFWLGETPVTQEQFAVWTEEAGIKHENHFKGKPDHPAEHMDWNEAVSFCKWLTASRGKQFPKGFQLAGLPSEAQWEYACRAGTKTEYWSGTGEGSLAAVGWYSANSKDSTQPVQQLAPNPWGLYDMHGNVDEWCADAWDEKAYAKRAHGVLDPFTDAKEGEEDPRRVIRGGSWDYSRVFCRSAFRLGRGASDRFGLQGFRVCLVPGPA